MTEDRIQAVHHVQITIEPDQEAEARAFYGGMLGLQEVPKPEALQGRGGMWFQLGAVQIHIGIESGVERQKSKAHVAYQVQDLETLRATLAQAGCQILESIPLPGMERFETRDPFGNRLEFLQLQAL